MYSRRLQPSRFNNLAGRVLPRRDTSTSASTTEPPTKKEGDISSVFASLSGSNEPAPPLPRRFADLKHRLISGHEGDVKRSWDRLLRKIKDEVGTVTAHGPNIIPNIEFKDIQNAPTSFREELLKRGVAVIRGVIPEAEARSYKEDIEAYARANPSTKAFPQHDPQVFELYWSKAQVHARSHPNMLATQRFLMSFWHLDDPNASISLSHPLTYADRLRIRQPGDTGFGLGPHIDGGSVERWEENGYGRGAVYDKILKGRWEEYDPWEASCRIPVEADLYKGAGACSMFRMFQGWLSMSHSFPREGTLLVNPLLTMSTAYTLLRPFFVPRSPLPGSENTSRTALDTFLDPANWDLETEATSTLHGATPGYAQELNNILHPHLELDRTMVHIPEIKPGDYVAWHCDGIHAVDKVHQGKFDSSVLYIPCCPVTENNAKYVGLQKRSFLNATPPPDFPGGQGESEHLERATETDLKELGNEEALRAFGFTAWNTDDPSLTPGQKKVLQSSNGFSGF